MTERSTSRESNANINFSGDVDKEKSNRDLSPVFPLLNNDETAQALSSDAATQSHTGEDDAEEEPAVAKPFVRTSSPDSAARVAEAYDEKGLDRLDRKMHKFSLYETATRYYIVGGDVTERRYRILKIERTTDDSELSITDDKIIYSQKEMNQLLDTIDDGNKGTGGIKLRCTTWGLLGFIKFTGPYYMLLITKKSTVAMIGGHYIYQVDGTELVPLTPTRFKADVRNTEESRFLGILNNLDLTRSFYYSYSYDITRTLQHNLTRERDALACGLPGAMDDFNGMFVWNSHLLQPAMKALKDPFDWCRPIIHGYIDQAGEFIIVVIEVEVTLLTADSLVYIWTYCVHHHNSSAVSLLCWGKIPQTRGQRSCESVPPVVRTHRTCHY